MEYSFKEIEEKWQANWREKEIYKVQINPRKPKFYVLDMFPYPSGSGLHVGHPLGYIASDIYSRYKRNMGFNVLHPMGYDAYGLPAEQYAIQTGTHPAITTEKNITRYRQQLDRIGFSFDWNREVRTCDPKYYKWTQWTFIKLFNHYYDINANKALPIEKLIAVFEKSGSASVSAVHNKHDSFTPVEWQKMDDATKHDILMKYRLAYLSYTFVNWCPKLGTVLANDEVVNGLSVRGGHPVERKLMKQWSLRITAYAQRLLDGLNTIDWPEAVKDIQSNWIGRSEGATCYFSIKGSPNKVEIFTTRPDTMFGASFMVLAPEHELVGELTTPDKSKEVAEYVHWAKNRPDVDRMADKKVSGVFTGSYAINPMNGNEIPVYIADYVLIGYGTGAIMAVPAHDSRDFAFARHFNLPVVQVVSLEKATESDTSEWIDSYDSKEGYMVNSGFITGLPVGDAIRATIEYLEKESIGTRQVNFRLRDAIFSRQRYWGEPFPVYYKNGIAYSFDASDLPLVLPEIDAFLPTETGEPPLARAANWKTKDGYPIETSTMPGFAGSSGYYLRYMNPDNENEYFSQEAVQYWKQVDLYIGGREHATGHLMYARFWNMFLYDLGMVVYPEPFAKLINQGMIQGRSNFVYRVTGSNEFVSFNLRNQYETQKIHVDVNIVSNDVLDIEAFKKWQPEFANAGFILEDGKYICGWEIEKMSKSLYNVQNPDDLIEKYGADTLRLYEMFLGPIEQAKPWDTNGIEGVFRFIKKLWRLYHNEKNEFEVSNEQATTAELKTIHTAIKKVTQDIERFSFNTAVSAFMICVNDLGRCNKKEVLEPLACIVSPFAPHIAEELWHLMGHNTSIIDAAWPQFDESLLQEDSITYPVSFNGKTRFQIDLPVIATKEEIEKSVLVDERTTKWVAEAEIVKIIVVPHKIINIVIKQN
ncbi:MAG: leucine--tRNA ligase [Bacteroidales bacterium]|nr:leucine--tRNA ligase [Bacteroidales bacterium]HOY39923.1 leucine--tRNA ligase [Bacteroidales bacterium]HQP03024.1 leucine--tRNA ligase [Bacteroidales bacterium]